MRARHSEHGTQIWISARETHEWANRAGAKWPCSAIAGRRLFAEFDSSGDLVGLTVDGRSDVDTDINEFSAITSDFLRERFGASHPAIR
jgi:hypothetical protein